MGDSSENALNQESSLPPKVLVVVHSAGFGAWKRIETRTQSKVLRNLRAQGMPVYWLSGQPNLVLGWDLRLREIWFGLLKSLHDGYPALVRKGARVFFSITPLFSAGSSRLTALADRLYVNNKKISHGERVFLPTPNSMDISATKTVAVFRHILEEHQFDYVLKITSTAVILPKPFGEFVAALPRKRVFAGTPQRFGLRTFLSGAVLVMSRDVVESVVSARNRLRHDIQEDVAVSWLIQDKNLAETFPFARADFGRLTDVPANFPQNSPDIWAVRCKDAGSSVLRPDDVEKVMKEIWKRAENDV